MSKLGKFVTICCELYRAFEEDKTKRMQLEAETKIKLETLKAQKEIFLEYINRSFTERRFVFDNIFQQLEKAIEKENVEVVQACVAMIIAQIKESPLKNYLDYVKKFDDKKSIEYF